MSKSKVPAQTQNARKSNTEIPVIKGTIGFITTGFDKSGHPTLTIWLIPDASQNTHADRHVIRRDNPVNRRIGIEQLQNTLPELLTVGDVLNHLMCNRSKLMGRELSWRRVPQTDREGKVAVGPNGNEYYNVRLVPSNADLTPEQAKALFASDHVEAVAPSLSEPDIE